MKVIDIIKNLSQRGHNIKYFKRSDGGYLITSIDGVKYTGATGNNVARQLAGTSLSVAQKQQREVAQSKQYGGLTKEERKAYQRLKLTYSKKGEGKKISISRFRQLKATIGSEGAISSAYRQAHYKRGYAYEKNVEWLIERLKAISMHFDSNSLNKVIRFLQNNINNIKDKDLTRAYQEAVYNMSNGSMKLEEGARILENIFHL